MLEDTEATLPTQDNTLAALRLQGDRTRKEFASLGELRPGSPTRPCDKPGCRCKVEDATCHGPYRSLTFKVQGKTVIRSIPEAPVERTLAQVAECKRDRALAAELVGFRERRSLTASCNV